MVELAEEEAAEDRVEEVAAPEGPTSPHDRLHVVLAGPVAVRAVGHLAGGEKLQNGFP